MPMSNKIVYLGGLTVQKQPERLEMVYFQDVLRMFSAERPECNSNFGYLVSTFGSFMLPSISILKSD